MSGNKLWISIVVLWFVSALRAQTVSSLTIELRSIDENPVTEATLQLENLRSGFARELVSIGTGLYTLGNLSLDRYTLRVSANGFAKHIQEIALRSNVPAIIKIVLQVPQLSETVSVSAQADALIDPEATGTRVALSREAMQTFAAPSGSRGLEAYLLSFPGFAQNANGAIHPRGAHNQMTYVIDGLTISDQLTGAFATAVDPNLVDNLELQTGNISAEFGAKVSGVAIVTTRTAAGSSRRFSGMAQLGGSSFDTLEQTTQAGGELGRFAWFGAFSGASTHRFLDQVSLDNLHNGGNAERAFVRLDYQAGNRDTLHFHVMAGRSSFELANLRSQQAAGMDQRQLLKDVSVWMRWHHLLSPKSSTETVVSYRPTVALLLPSAGDTPVTAAQARHLTTASVRNRLTRIAGAHTLRAGVGLDVFPVSENFTMAVTSPAFSASGLPSPFVFSEKATGTLLHAFAEDSFRYGRFAATLGLRFDDYHLLVRGRQVQPRLGVAFHLKETGSVLRASYNRNYQTPPNENLLLSSAQVFGNPVVPLQPQRENVYEAGLQQALFGRASLNLSLYHKDSLDQQDNNNFFNTGVIFPITLAKIRVNGAEARLVLPTVRGFSASLSATHARAISTPPTTGGLFLGQDVLNALNSGPFVIDHDQKLSVAQMRATR